MFADLIRAHIIIEDNMLNRMILLKNGCLDENIHNVFEKKKGLLKTIVLNTDCISRL